MDETSKPNMKYLYERQINGYFQFDPVTMTCICPAGESLRHEGTRTDQNGVPRAHFQGRLLQCRHCP